jgi:hypothetical protein
MGHRYAKQPRPRIYASAAPRNRECPHNPDAPPLTYVLLSLLGTRIIKRDDLPISTSCRKGRPLWLFPSQIRFFSTACFSTNSRFNSRPHGRRDGHGQTLRGCSDSTPYATGPNSRRDSSKSRCCSQHHRRLPRCRRRLRCPRAPRSRSTSARSLPGGLNTIEGVTPRQFVLWVGP